MLHTAGLSVRYGSNVVVVGADLDVGAGELVGLIGANGAGKTTTIDAVSGFVRHGGTVHLDGTDLSSLPPHERARSGIGRTWQGIELFDDLTVRQNCLVAARPPGWKGVLRDLLHRPDDAATDARVDDALAAVGLAATPPDARRSCRTVIRSWPVSRGHSLAGLGSSCSTNRPQASTRPRASRSV